MPHEEKKPVSEQEQSDPGGGFDEVCLYLGFLLGSFSRPEVYQKLVASLRDPEGIRTVYIVRLRDQLSEALREAGKE